MAEGDVGMAAVEFTTMGSLLVEMREKRTMRFIESQKLESLLCDV